MVNNGISGWARFDDVAFAYSVENIIDSWIAFSARHSTGSVSKEALVIEWLPDYTSLSFLEGKFARIVARGISSLSADIQTRLSLWLEQMLAVSDPAEIDPQESAQTRNTFIHFTKLLQPIYQKLRHHHENNG